MMTIVKTHLIKIGNSLDIRTPKLLQQAGLQDEVQVTAAFPRQGWEQQFQAMAAHEDDRLLDADALPTTEWKDKEW